MTQRLKIALCILRYTLGIVILIEAILFVLPSARHDFAKTHMPDVIRQILGGSETIGALLVLIPRTARQGAWLLLATFILAIILHLLHGAYNVGNLAIYIAAAFTIAADEGRA
jgi:uncharacterized membrane protein YphA (DoxX/SURF4 family)